MKKVIFSLTLAALAMAAQAGNDGCCQDNSGGCCSKAAGQQQTKAACPSAGKATRKTASVKKPLRSPKAAAEIAQR